MLLTRPLVSSRTRCASSRSFHAPLSSLFSNLRFFFSSSSQRKSLDKASPKLGAAIRMAMVQMMLKTLNPTRHRRSITAAANCHCSDTLSCLSCSRTRSTKNCTSTSRACSWLSTAAEGAAPPWVSAAAGLTAPAPPSSGPQVVNASGSGDSSWGDRPNFMVWMWCGSGEPSSPSSAPAPSSAVLFLPRLMVLLR